MRRIPFFFLAIGLTLLFSACSESGEDGKEGLHEKIKNLDNPLTTYEVDQEVYQFGKVRQGEPVEHTFLIENTGKVPLIISKVTPDCGCTAPKNYDGTIKPGESGEIEVVFDSSRQKGQITKHVRVSANTEKPIVLTIKGEVLYQ